MPHALPWGSRKSLAPSPTLGGEWAAPPSQARVCAGRASTPPGRCQGLHNGAPGIGARLAHSALNNHGSAAAGPSSLQGREDRQEGSRWATGVRFPAWGGGVGSPEGGRRRVRLLPEPPAAPPSLWSLKEGGCGGTVCPPSLPPRAVWRGIIGSQAGLS